MIKIIKNIINVKNWNYYYNNYKKYKLNKVVELNKIKDYKHKIIILILIKYIHNKYNVFIQNK